MPREVSLVLPYKALVEAVAQLGPDEVVALVKKVDEHLADWSLINSLKSWVDTEHRKMIREETEDRANRTGQCTRSEEYPEIHVHVDPHRGCILRSAHP